MADEAAVSQALKDVLGDGREGGGSPSDVKVTKDELDQEQFDATVLMNKDPAFKYRFSRKDDVAFARNKMKGYVVVDRNDDAVRSIVGDSTPIKKGADLATTIEVGDMVLMRIPLANYEENLRRRQGRIDRVTRGVSASAKQRINSAGQRPGLAYEEHKANPGMHGMSEAAFNKLQGEMAHESAERQSQERRNR